MMFELDEILHCVSLLNDNNEGRAEYNFIRAISLPRVGNKGVVTLDRVGEATKTICQMTRISKDPECWEVEGGNDFFRRLFYERIQAVKR